MTNLIETTKLAKDYPGKTALSGLSFNLKKGEILGLLGPNGAGKTTALHILMGILAPTSGEARVFGLSPQNDRVKIARRLNFASAYATLPSNLKVSENLHIFSMLYGVANARQTTAALLKLFGISHLTDRVTGALSSGEKTRLNLVKSLLNAPELLLLDEPTASLDPEMADHVRKTLKEIQSERGIGVIYTSHNMREVEEVCDRVIFIHEGREVASGTPAQIRERFRMKSLDEVFIKLVREDEELR